MRTDEAVVRAPEGEEAQVSALEGLVEELRGCYEALERVGDRRMEAIRRARTGEIGSCIGEENGLVQRIADLEKRRVALVGAMAERYGLSEKTQSRLSVIASRIGGETGARIVEKVEVLRGVIERVQRRNEVAREATGSLAVHMRGLLRKVAERLNHAKTYGRGGLVDAGVTVVSALDIRS